MPPKKKPTDRQISQELAAMAMKQLRALPEEERETHIAEFARRVSKS